jgi:hypothetical protein
LPACRRADCLRADFRTAGAISPKRPQSRPTHMAATTQVYFAARYLPRRKFFDEVTGSVKFCENQPDFFIVLFHGYQALITISEANATSPTKLSW